MILLALQITLYSMKKQQLFIFSFLQFIEIGGREESLLVLDAVDNKMDHFYQQQERTSFLQKLL